MVETQSHKMPRGYNWFPEWIPIREVEIELTRSSIDRLLEVIEENQVSRKNLIIRLYSTGDKLHIGLDQVKDSIKHLHDIGIEIDQELYLVIDERELENFLKKIINYDKELKEFTICSKNQSAEN
jgi:hypothetical protein